MTDFVVVIPARYASTRLPGKPLRDINGKPMLQHVFERGVESGASDVIVATDDERIADAAEAFGATVCMTRDDHQSGTDRIAEVSDIFDWDDAQVVVNLQGDEPAMPAALLGQCAALLDEPQADIATLASPLASESDRDNPNVVKAILDDAGYALYFTRAPVPCALHHHGLYAYRVGVLRRIVAAQQSKLEIAERLEQLRALSMGLKIRVAIPDVRPGAGVDTEEDLQAAARELQK